MHYIKPLYTDFYRMRASGATSTTLDRAYIGLWLSIVHCIHRALTSLFLCVPMCSYVSNVKRSIVHCIHRTLTYIHWPSQYSDFYRMLASGAT